jgi:hypothetical protein
MGRFLKRAINAPILPRIGSLEELKMWKDPIVVEEIHLVREKIAEECNYDLKKIVNRLRKKEKENHERVVSKIART